MGTSGGGRAQTDDEVLTKKRLRSKGGRGVRMQRKEVGAEMCLRRTVSSCGSST